MVFVFVDSDQNGGWGCQDFLAGLVKGENHGVWPLERLQKRKEHQSIRKPGKEAVGAWAYMVELRSAWFEELMIRGCSTSKLKRRKRKSSKGRFVKAKGIASVASMSRQEACFGIFNGIWPHLAWEPNWSFKEERKGGRTEEAIPLIFFNEKSMSVSLETDFNSSLVANNSTRSSLIWPVSSINSFGLTDASF